MKTYQLLPEKISLVKIANCITLFRLLAGLPVIVCLNQGNVSLAWLLIFLAGLSDMADGYLARKAGKGSIWGARFDPLADKILLSAPLIWLSSRAVIPIWAVWILISRELIITGWRSTEAKGGKASIGGKAKTLIQFSCVLLMLWPINWGGLYVYETLNKAGWYLFWPSLFLTVVSGFRYLRFNSKSHPN